MQSKTTWDRLPFCTRVGTLTSFRTTEVVPERQTSKREILWHLSLFCKNSTRPRIFHIYGHTPLSSTELTGSLLGQKVQYANETALAPKSQRSYFQSFLPLTICSITLAFESEAFVSIFHSIDRTLALNLAKKAPTHMSRFSSKRPNVVSLLTMIVPFLHVKYAGHLMCQAAKKSNSQCNDRTQEGP